MTENHEIKEQLDFQLQILNSVQQAVFVTDTDAKVVFWNDFAEKLYGYSKNEAIGKTTIELIAPVEQVNERIEKFEEIKNSNSSFTRYLVKNKRGKEFPISLATHPIYDSENDVIAIVGTSHDITAEIECRKELIEAKEKANENEKRYEDLFLNLLDEVHIWKVIKDKNGAIKTWELIDANPPALKAWKKTKEQVVGKTANENFGDGTDKLFMPIVEKIFETGKPHKWEEYFPSANQYLSMASIPLGDVFISTGRDITEKRKADNELVKAKEKAEESDRLKTEFINNMSHEIRTPMNGILGFSNFLNNENLSADKRKNYINIIQNCGQQLMRIIDDILEISELGTKQVATSEKEVCLNDLLFELFSIFDIKAKENKVPLFFKKGLSDSESTLLTDDTRLIKIMSNLLENALKFTNTGFIEFGYLLKNNHIEIYVKDTGIGIKPENQDTIFERFSQEEKGISRNVGGLGLGLSIAKENTELLGGKITLTSEKGNGSTFVVTIPYKPVKSENEENNSNIEQKVKSPDKYTILIAEDEEVNYLYIETLLEDEIDINCEIIHAKNGKEAVEMCKENPAIDFVLMDIKMPLMNGYEATRLIREFKPHLPIVAQTAYATDENIAISAGCDDFISKPISQETINRIINKYLIKS